MPKKYLRLAIVILGIWFPLRSSSLAQVSSGSPRELRVGLKESPPFTFKNARGEWEGISIRLWENVAHNLGLKWTYVESTLPDLLDDVVRHKVDVVIGSLTVTLEREKTMDFTHSTYSSGLGIVSRHAKRTLLATILDGVFSFDFLKSISILFLVLILAGGMLCLAERKRNPQFQGTTAMGLGDGLWWSAVTMTTVGYGDKSPVTLVGRLIAIVWMFTSVMIISSLTATIAASLTVRKLVPAIKTFADLPGHKIATLASSSSDLYLGQSGFKNLEYFPDIPSALRALKEQKIDVVVYDAPILNYYLQKWDDDKTLSLVEDNTFPQHYAFIVPENSGYLEEFNQALLKFTASEVWDETLKKYIPKAKDE